MDALPMEENTNLRWRSTIPGRFHGCGHDGHTTMLLGTARYLAETRNFDGTVHFIFQPAEEGLGGARAMIKDGLFEKFPCDELYGLHNAPDLNHGEIAILPGPAMAGADFFDIVINGYGAHGAMPERSKDAVVIAMTVGKALQTIVSRNVDPLQSAVLSITQIHAGSAYNVIPGEAKLCGTVRAFSDEVRSLIRDRMRTICAGMAAAFQVEINVDIRDIFSAHGGRSRQGVHAHAAQDGQRGLCRHAADHSRRLFLGWPRRFGAGAQSRLCARRQDPARGRQHVRPHHRNPASGRRACISPGRKKKSPHCTTFPPST
jgi:hippurate hydrolase